MEANVPILDRLWRIALSIVLGGDREVGPIEHFSNLKVVHNVALLRQVDFDVASALAFEGWNEIDGHLQPPYNAFGVGLFVI